MHLFLYRAVVIILVISIYYVFLCIISLFSVLREAHYT